MEGAEESGGEEPKLEPLQGQGDVPSTVITPGPPEQLSGVAVVIIIAVSGVMVVILVVVTAVGQLA